MASVFIERQFELGEARVVLRLFVPEPSDKDYGCEYSIVWPDREQRRRIFGIDAVQALLLAMQMAHVDLLLSPESKAGQLTWLEERDFGLPFSPGTRREDFA
jgi:uncharacterized protein DUF6968